MDGGGVVTHNPMVGAEEDEEATYKDHKEAADEGEDDNSLAEMSILQHFSFLVVLMLPAPNSAESTPMLYHLKVAHRVEAGAFLGT